MAREAIQQRKGKANHVLSISSSVRLPVIDLISKVFSKFKGFVLLLFDIYLIILFNGDLLL